MRIGELAERTGASVRSLRHYEANGLISAQRQSNGYREFTEDSVRAVGRIRSLLEAGLPVAAIRKILPCVLDPDLTLQSCESVVAVLQAELNRIKARTDQLDRARTVISGMLSS